MRNARSLPGHAPGLTRDLCQAAEPARAVDNLYIRLPYACGTGAIRMPYACHTPVFQRQGGR